MKVEKNADWDSGHWRVQYWTKTGTQMDTFGEKWTLQGIQASHSVALLRPTSPVFFPYFSWAYGGETPVGLQRDPNGI